MTDRMTAIAFSRPDSPEPIALGTMEGSWWVDWPAMEALAADPGTAGPGALALAMLARMFLAARPSLAEVSQERADEIALEWGKRGVTP